jgi:hypothetical protein
VLIEKRLKDWPKHKKGIKESFEAFSDEEKEPLKSRILSKRTIIFVKYLELIIF